MGEGLQVGDAVLTTCFFTKRDINEGRPLNKSEEEVALWEDQDNN